MKTYTLMEVIYSVNDTKMKNPLHATHLGEELEAEDWPQNPEPTIDGGVIIAKEWCL